MPEALMAKVTSTARVDSFIISLPANPQRARLIEKPLCLASPFVALLAIN
jgi:hypothetical protein